MATTNKTTNSSFMTELQKMVNGLINDVPSSLRSMNVGGSSMTMPQVADALAPGLPHRVIGIRPGEKLHEMMISVDDARMTTELPDRYVIEPEFVEYTRTPFSADLGRRVADGFAYSSDSNSEWLDAAGLATLLAGHG